MGDIGVWPQTLLVENLTSHAAAALVSLNGTAYSGSPSVALSTTSDKGWLGLPSPAATVPGPLQISVTPGGLNPGAYGGLLNVSSIGLRVAPSVVPVTLVIANFQLSTSSLSLTPDFGGEQTVRVSGGSALYFDVTSSVPWLHADYPAGITPARINVWGDSSGMASGTYAGMLIFTPQNAPADAATVQVTLTVP
jgi:hypothetical protein